MKTVIFACVHNAGRSQMAAAFFNALADPALARAISAGTHPAGRVHPEVVEVMRDAGIDVGIAADDAKMLPSYDFVIPDDDIIEVGDLRLDPAARRVWRGDTEVSLSAKEFQLLETFMRHPGEVLSRYQLLEHAWDYDYENRSNIVDVYVRYLRDKIDRPFGRDSLETVRGVGYRLRREPPAV